MANLTTRQSEAVTTLLTLWRTGTPPPYAFKIVTSVQGDTLVRFLQSTYLHLRYDGRTSIPCQDEQAFQQYLVENIETMAKQDEAQREQREALRAEEEIRKAQEAARRAREEAEAKARVPAQFADLGRQMAATNSRAILVQLSRERAKLVDANRELFPTIGSAAKYGNICWQCRKSVSSAIHARCRDCGWYICSCGACQPHCSGYTM